MSSDCSYHISVTPYHPSLIREGVTAVEIFDPSLLERRQWPRYGHHKRLPEGGCGGEVVAEQLAVTWHNNKLISPLSNRPEPLAERVGSEIVYHGAFVVQLDGQVAYSPDPSSGGHLGAYVILVESPVAEQQAVRFSAHQTAVVDPLVKHSMPIPVEVGAEGARKRETFEFAVWHRSLNAVLQLSADPATPTPIVVNLHKVDRTKEIIPRLVDPLAPSAKLLQPSATKINPLPVSFARQVLQLEEATSHALAPYGQLVHDAMLHRECVSEVLWPGMPDASKGKHAMGNGNNGCPAAGQLEQDFLVAWQPEDDVMELEFEGISGSFAGNRGRPGVDFHPHLGIYAANLLMARPDGSFYVRAAEHGDNAFAMAVALPTHSDGGDPIEESLRVFAFRDGTAPRLNQNVWHSVPIPLISGKEDDWYPILFREIVAASNANVVINVRAECGHPIQFSEEMA